MLDKNPENKHLRATMVIVPLGVVVFLKMFMAISIFSLLLNRASVGKKKGKTFLLVFMKKKNPNREKVIRGEQKLCAFSLSLSVV